MSLKQSSARTAYISTLLLFLVGCAANTTPPSAGQAGSPQSTTTATCVADGSGWKCDSEELATSSSQPRRVAVASSQPSTSATSERKSVPWWKIRVRNNREDQSDNASQPALAETQTSSPRVQSAAAPVVASTIGQPGAVVASTPDYQTTSQPSQPVAAPVYQATPSVNTWSQPVQQQPTTTTTYTLTPQVQETTQTFVAGDGLGRDFDYAVQLAAFSDYSTSSDFLREFPTLELKRIKTLSNGRTFYIVIAGTYETKQLAEAQSQMLRTAYGLGDPYIRTVRSIRTAKEN